MLDGRLEEDTDRLSVRRSRTPWSSTWVRRPRSTRPGGPPKRSRRASVEVAVLLRSRPRRTGRVVLDRGVVSIGDVTRWLRKPAAQGEGPMKIVVIGGTGLIGSKVVAMLRRRATTRSRRHPTRASTPSPARVWPRPSKGASVVVDVSNSPSFDEEPALEFFQTSTRNLLAAEAVAGVKHHVALSVVGTERCPRAATFAGRPPRRQLIKASSIPYSIVHATQFFEFLKSIAGDATDGDTCASRLCWSSPSPPPTSRARSRGSRSARR